MELIEKALNRRIQKLITRYHKKSRTKLEGPDARIQRRIRWVQKNLELEGTFLRDSDLHALLEEGNVPAEMKLSDMIYALNYNDCYKITERAALSEDRLDENLILRIHKITMRNLSDETSGEYRKTPVRKKGGFAPPAPVHIAALVRDLCDWLEAYKNRFNPQDLAFWTHHRLLYIRPFVFGTETTARHLLNFVLFSFDLPPLTLDLESKDMYEHFNQEANLDRYQGYMTFMGQRLEQSLKMELENKKPEETESKELTMPHASRLSGISRDKLSRDARNGVLRARKENRVWFTTTNDLAEYLEKINEN